MSRRLLAALAVALAVPGLSAAPVPADGAKSIDFPYPAKAPIVVCLNGYDRARGRLDKMLTAALPKDIAAITKLLDATHEHLFEGRKLTAIRKDARVFLVVNNLEEVFDGSPAVSVLVPVTNYKDFFESFLTKVEQGTLDRGRDRVDAIKTAAFGEEMPIFLVDLKEYAVITPHRGTADGYAAKYTAANSDGMGPELAETFIKGDLSVYINMDVINDEFGDQLRGLKGLIDFGLQQAQQQGALQEFNQRQIDALKTILKGVMQAVEDCRGVVLMAEFRPEGLYVRIQARFAENSPSAKLIASEPPATLADLGKFPAGLGMYQAVRFGKTIGDLVRELGQEFSTTDDDVRGADLIEGHLKDLAAAGPGAEFHAAPPPGVTFSVTAYKDAAKAAKALSKTYKAVGPGGRIGGVVVKTAPRVGDEAEMHRDFTFTSVNLNHDFDATVAGLPEDVRESTLATLKLATPEKAALWIGQDGKVVVRIMAKDWDAAKALLDKYLDGKSTVGATRGYKRVREVLPGEANLLIFAEVESALTSALGSMKAAGEAIPGFPQLGPLKKPTGDRAYVGVAVSLKGDTATVTAFVPVQAITAGREILESLFKKFE